MVLLKVAFRAIPFDSVSHFERMEQAGRPVIVLHLKHPVIRPGQQPEWRLVAVGDDAARIESLLVRLLKEGGANRAA